MNNKAFCNLFCDPQNSFHTSPGSSDSNNKDCQFQIFFKLNNGIKKKKNTTRGFKLNKSIYKKKKKILLAVKFLVNAIVEFEEYLKASIIWFGRSRRGVKMLLWITKQITKSFVILMRQIMIETN